MTTEKASWAVRVYGEPAPKGSLKCVGGKGRHQLIEDGTRTKPWRALVKQAGEALSLPGPLSGPVGVEAVFTVRLPASVKAESRLWPWKRSTGIGGDVDKLLRTVLDALEDAGVLADDAQVCVVRGSKCYPHSPAAGVLDRPGMLLRVWRIEGAA